MMQAVLMAAARLTLWEVMVDSLLGKSSETGLHRLAEDLLTGGGERGDLQGVQLWDTKPGTQAY